MKSLRILFSGISLLLLFLFISPSTHADTGTAYEVGTSSLNVRSAPTQNAAVLGSLHPGDEVIVFQEHYGWAQTYYGGQEAWVASQYLYPADQSGNASNASTSNTVSVNTEGVHVRSGPGTNYSILGFAASGDTYTKVETQNNWHKVLLQNGSTGWIAAWLTNSYNGGHSTVRAVAEPPLDSKGSLEGYTIVLDPGHGGNDPGAIGFNGALEKNLTLSIAEVVASHLREAGATVNMTRQNDHYLSLKSRTEFSSKYETDAFISLHYNAFPFMSVNGISAFYYASGQELAASIQNQLDQQVSLHNRGVQFGNYHVLRENNDLSVLLELGFITNPNDLFLIQTNGYQRNVAQAITDGVKNYFRK
ncbi:N-acetylmuramoyl-L-alanine amidase [Virgibacillus flavescens]|uniref:N-acetylmuramoyl-L-alanine amidase n=1 Tax=Virgibacillus flavescens TaxID=1611422 RepID=UPI003D32A42A